MEICPRPLEGIIFIPKLYKYISNVFIKKKYDILIYYIYIIITKNNVITSII